MNLMGDRCETCTHWADTDDDYGICAVLGAGWDDTRPPVYLTRSHTVFTRNDFGCTEHQPTEESPR